MCVRLHLQLPPDVARALAGASAAAASGDPTRSDAPWVMQLLQGMGADTARAVALPPGYAAGELSKEHALPPNALALQLHPQRIDEAELADMLAAQPHRTALQL
jgi:hypothetical protein